MESMMNRRMFAALIAVTVAAVAGVIVARPSSPALAGGTIDRHDYVPHITNPWLPFRVGPTWVFLVIKAGATQIDTVHVTIRTRQIMGVRCTAVSDIATHAGAVLERTTDWYAQDRKG